MSDNSLARPADPPCDRWSCNIATMSRTNKSAKGQEKEDCSYNLCDVLQTRVPDIDAIIKNAVETATATIKTEIVEIVNTKLDKLKKDLKTRDDKIVALEKENVALKTLLNNQAQAIENIEVYARVDNLPIQGFWSRILTF